MQRLIASLLVLVLTAASGHVSALHIHAYIEHDHAEHRHGLAAHEHERATETHAPDSAVHLERCDPGRHTVSFAFVCAAAVQTHAVDADSVTLALSATPIRLIGVAAITDIRVHGPPCLTQAPPRGPPLDIPA